MADALLNETGAGEIRLHNMQEEEMQTVTVTPEEFALLITVVSIAHRCREAAEQPNLTRGTRADLKRRAETWKRLADRVGRE